MRSRDGIKITFIVKVSKLCNLRCAYCYEMPELANKARMSVDDIGKMFRNVRDYFKSEEFDYRKCRVEFIWHGGEPFAQPFSYWEEILAAQKKIFGARFQKENVTNTVQTNMTLLGEKHWPLLRDNFSVGFSYDVKNELRVNVAGNPTAETVERKVGLALAAGVALFGIAVISQANAGFPAEIADYFLSRGISFRALNIYQNLDASADIRAAAVPFEAYLDFCRSLAALPQVRRHLEQGTQLIDPLSTAYNKLQYWKHLSGKKHKKELDAKQCATLEWALGVNTNGDTYAIGDVYFPEYRYGNVFTQPIARMLESEGRTRRVSRSRERLKKVCSKCFLYRDGCAGTYVSHATPEIYREYERAGGCETGLLAKEMRDGLLQSGDKEPLDHASLATHGPGPVTRRPPAVASPAA